MKIKVSDIPKDGLALEEKQDAASLDLMRDDLKFVSPIALTAFVTRDKDEVFAHVEAHGRIEAICGRCLSVYNMDFNKEFDFNYDARGRTAIDLTDDIRQEIILEYPLKPLCKESCKGLCQVCGKNLNEENCTHKGNAQRWNEFEKAGN